MGILDPAPKVLRPQREADCSLLSSVEATNAWSCTFTPPYFFVVWCLIKHRDKFFLLFLCVLLNIRLYLFQNALNKIYLACQVL
jgi:hypothetical protein